MAHGVRDFNTQSLSPLSQAYSKVKTMWRNKAVLFIMARKKCRRDQGSNVPLKGTILMTLHPWPRSHFLIFTPQHLSCYMLSTNLLTHGLFRTNQIQTIKKMQAVSTHKTSTLTQLTCEKREDTKWYTY